MNELAFSSKISYNWVCIVENKNYYSNRRSKYIWRDYHRKINILYIKNTDANVLLKHRVCREAINRVSTLLFFYYLGW
jgi:hypothetical protein